MTERQQAKIAIHSDPKKRVSKKCACKNPSYMKKQKNQIEDQAATFSDGSKVGSNNYISEKQL